MNKNKSKKNIVILFPDQLRHDFLGCYGAEFIKTPNIDLLSKNGVTYENAYASSPVCVPSRTSLLTGLNSLKHGVTGNFDSLRPDYKKTGLKTWPDIIKEDGYNSAAIGKMHFYPWDARHGFDYRRIAEDKRHIHVKDDYFKKLRSAGLRKFHGDEHEGYQENFTAIKSIVPYEHSWDHFVGEEAVRYINNHSNDEPFAMMVGFPGPHDPYDPSEDFHVPIPDENSMPDPIPFCDHDKKFAEAQEKGLTMEWANVKTMHKFNDKESLVKKKKMRAHYAGLVQQIDYEVGRIVSTLKENDLFDNTIIIFASDHGDYLGDHGLFGKGTFIESSSHVPLIVQTPETMGNPKRIDDLVYLFDITSTMLQFTGSEVPDYFDSIPLPGLPGIKTTKRNELFGYMPDGWMIYDGLYKLCKYSNGTRTLFNMKEDPEECKNLYKDKNVFKIRRNLESRLSVEIMNSIRFSFFDRQVDTINSLNEKDDFGKEAWDWDYPAQIRPLAERSDRIEKGEIKFDR